MKDTASRETEPIKVYNLVYGIGQNCDLGRFMEMITVFNSAYLDDRINDEIFNSKDNDD